MGPRRKGGGKGRVSLLTMIDRNNKWIQTQIYTHTKQKTLTSTPPVFPPYHPVLTHLTWSLPIFLYIYFSHGPEFSLLTIPLPDRVLKENKSRQTKQKNSKINTKRITVPKSTEVRVASANETKKHTVNTPGLNTAPSLTQEVRQSLEKQEQSTGSLLALQRFPRVV